MNVEQNGKFDTSGSLMTPPPTKLKVKHYATSVRIVNQS